MTTCNVLFDSRRNRRMVSNERILEITKDYEAFIEKFITHRKDNKQLTPSQIVICITILTFSEKTFPSIKTLQDQTGLRRRSIFREMNALVSFGIVEKEKTLGKCSSYKLNEYL